MIKVSDSAYEDFLYMVTQGGYKKEAPKNPTKEY